MTLVDSPLGRGVALALFGEHMDEHGTGGAGLHRAQHRHELFHVMAVDGADIGEAQLLEKRAANNHPLDEVARALGPFAQRRRQEMECAFRQRFEVMQRLFGVEPREIFR